MLEEGSDQVGTRQEDIADALGSIGSTQLISPGAIGQLANGHGHVSQTSSYHKYSARMTTERHAAEYNFRHKNRGLALIFNHEHFEVIKATVFEQL